MEHKTWNWYSKHPGQATVSLFSFFFSLFFLIKHTSAQIMLEMVHEKVRLFTWHIITSCKAIKQHLNKKLHKYCTIGVSPAVHFCCSLHSRATVHQTHENMSHKWKPSFLIKPGCIMSQQPLRSDLLQASQLVNFVHGMWTGPCLFHVTQL